ncbi:MAG: acetolactate decarboxylase [Sneathiellaceae bacterium]
MTDDEDHHRDPEIMFARALHAHHDGKASIHDDHEKAQEFFQTSMMSALLNGVYDGEMTFRELAQHGDFGLGTFNALDGEMVLIDGAFFALRADGKAHAVDPDWQTPFSSVMFFQAEVEQAIDAPMDRKALEALLDSIARKRNGFYAVRVDGLFSHVAVRTVPRQEKPYPPMVEVVKHQPKFEYRDIRGSLIGFRLPDYTVGINIPGYHLHFIDDARTCGGHMTAFTIAEGRLAIDHTINLHLEIPQHSSDFDEAELAGGDLHKDIQTTES